MLETYYQNGLITLYHGDVRDVLPCLEPESIQMCVTSPPYWGLRDYGVDGQIGAEQTPHEFVKVMVEVGEMVKRVLRKDATMWLNLGDSYAGSRGTGGKPGDKQYTNRGTQLENRPDTHPGLKPKDQCLVPQRVGIAMQDAGWWVRSDIIWSKPNGMPSSQDDRPTCAHEYIWLLAKNADYYYDQHAVRRPPSEALLKQIAQGYNGEALKGFEGTGAENASDVKSRIIAGAREKIDKQRGHSRQHAGFNDRWDNLTHEEQMAAGSTQRDVWEIAPQPFIAEYCTNCQAFFLGAKEVRRIPVSKVNDLRVMTCPKCGSTDCWVSHFAVFPEEIPTRAIKAGTSERGCCVECGSPWERVTEKSTEPHPNRYSKAADAKQFDAQDGDYADAGSLGVAHVSKTLGWRPTCSCGAETKPCTVLDCFNGSGRSGIAALKLGRNYIGIDLNLDYLQMAKLQFERILAQPSLAIGVGE